MSNIDASAKNMAAIVKAKDEHNANCPYGGMAVRILMHPFDLDRLGWEEGDTIAGLTIVADTKVNTGMLRVECDAEKPNHGEGLVESKGKAVGKPMVDRDLIPA